MTNQMFSRAVSAATLGYAVFSLVKPEHLGRAMDSDAFEQPTYDRLARAYGVRDVVIGGLGLAGPSPKVVRTAMVLRIVGDLGDAVVLGSRAPDAKVRAKVLAVTLGYAVLNAAALVRDARRS
ncbi:hypothetical protein [Nocardioides sp. W7]|uniref:hypothetical protein n=1 Tax=Nocardioides sp. W7 TaxID=2931390 RepID=UPI001FD44E21|nr:hypothetical protein [Nocardioides sp. W7]